MDAKMRRCSGLAVLDLLLFGLAWRASGRDSEPFFKAVRPGALAIGASQQERLGIFGLEGSFYTRTQDGSYHFFSAGRLPAPAPWQYTETDVHMRFDHWQSANGKNWEHVGKIYESSGIYDGTDGRGSTWAPMLAFDEAEDVWHLFYVAYRASPDYKIKLGLYGNKALHYYTQWDGEIWHAVSNVSGDSGIGGPYNDVGPILNQENLGGFDVQKDGWEGDHGCDMFYPYRLPNGSWVALYGSEFGRAPDFCEPTCRQVGLVAADHDGLAGKWSRLSHLNPLDAGFRPAQPGIENPVVTKTQDGQFYVAVYHVYTGSTIGVSFSRDGLNWTRQAGDVELGHDLCGNSVTTACGLVPEPDLGPGVYSLLYTAGGPCRQGNCTGESACHVYLVNEAEQGSNATVFV